MKEIRVYAINCDMYEGEVLIQELSDDKFMDIAEEQGLVYSLEQFAYDYNNEYMDNWNTFIRFIEV